MGASLPSGASAFCSLGVFGFFSSFAGAAFSGSFASFSGAVFSGSFAAFCGAVFSGSFAAFSGVTFSGSFTAFSSAAASGAFCSFPGAGEPPRAAPGLCPDRLRQSGFSIFHRPFAIPPSWFSGMKKGLDLSCQAPVVGLPPFPAPMKKPPFVVKERFFSRLAVHYFVFYMYPFVHCCNTIPITYRLIILWKF